jgi:hypothetical protein
MLGFITIKTALIVVHLFGAVIGMGGAFASDLMFFHSIRDGRISSTELGFLELGSKMVWVGLFFIAISGAGLFLTNPDGYMESSKFLAKMSIVLVIIINGIYFHKSHIPFLAKISGVSFSKSPELQRKRFALLLSGVVSVVSWSSALILGVFKSVPYPYTTIMLSFLIIVGLGILIATILKNKLLPCD